MKDTLHIMDAFKSQVGVNFWFIKLPFLVKNNGVCGLEQKINK